MPGDLPTEHRAGEWQHWDTNPGSLGEWAYWYFLDHKVFLRSYWVLYLIGSFQPLQEVLRFIIPFMLIRNLGLGKVK